MHFTLYGWTMIAVGTLLVLGGLLTIFLTLATGKLEERRCRK